MGRFLWDEINENSDDVLNKLENSKSTKIISTPSTSLPSTSAPSNDRSLVEKEVEEAPETKLADEAELDQEKDESVTKDDVSKWSQYKDKEDEFTFRYPETVLVEASGESIKISATDEEWKIKKYSNKDGSGLDVWYQNYFSEKERKNCVLSGGDLKVGKYETRLAKGSSSEKDCDKAGYFFFDDSKKVVIRIESEQEVTEQMKEILKTFEFDEE